MTKIYLLAGEEVKREETGFEKQKEKRCNAPMRK